MYKGAVLELFTFYRICWVPSDENDIGNTFEPFFYIVFFIQASLLECLSCAEFSFGLNSCKILSDINNSLDMSMFAYRMKEA